MLRPRIIPSLLLQENGLVKTVNFKNPKYVGDPINAVKIFNEKEVLQKKPVNLFFPRSFCPNCLHTLKWWQNIPLLSYLFLRAKCFYCHNPISFRYFFIEGTYFASHSIICFSSHFRRKATISDWSVELPN